MFHAAICARSDRWAVRTSASAACIVDSPQIFPAASRACVRRVSAAVISSAKIFVVACQPVETSRLLLLSRGPRHPDGLGNNLGQVGRYLLFSASASAEGAFPYAEFDEARQKALRDPRPFINRTIQDWYFLDDPRVLDHHDAIGIAHRR